MVKSYEAKLKPIKVRENEKIDKEIYYFHVRRKEKHFRMSKELKRFY